jgi:hypothetical protein
MNNGHASANSGGLRTKVVTLHGDSNIDNAENQHQKDRQGNGGLHKDRTSPWRGLRRRSLFYFTSH